MSITLTEFYMISMALTALIFLLIGIVWGARIEYKLHVKDGIGVDAMELSIKQANAHRAQKKRKHTLPQGHRTSHNMKGHTHV